MSASSSRLRAGMLRTRKWRPGLYSFFILTLLSAIAPPVATADDEIPSGFKADRYQKVWERNPFTLVTPPAAQVRTTPFDKLILISWLNDGGKDVVFVQNTETNEIEKITNDPNPNNLRLVEIHKNADPLKADVVLSSGAEKGVVKFRLEVAAAALQASAGQQPPGAGPGNQFKVPGAAPGPGMRQMQTPQNAQQALQQAGRMGAAQMQQGAVPVQPNGGATPPRASEVRRKRLTPPPPNEQPVGAPVPYQNQSNQSPPQ
jgi:hypothetical protein